MKQQELCRICAKKETCHNLDNPTFFRQVFLEGEADTECGFKKIEREGNTLIRKKIWMVELVSKRTGEYEENYYMHDWSQIKVVKDLSGDDNSNSLVIGTGFYYVYFPTATKLRK